MPTLTTSDYTASLNWLIQQVESKDFQQANPDGISLNYLNALLEGALDVGNIPFPQRICEICGHLYRVDTLIEPHRLCARLHISLVHNHD